MAREIAPPVGPGLHAVATDILTVQMLLRWQATENRYFLDRRSVGLCVNAAGSPGGPVVIVRI